MAVSPSESKALHHGRSLSLPSTSTPSIFQIDENLSRVKASQATSLSSFSDGISALKNLYCSLDEFLLFPHTQQNISQEQWVDQLLDGHITLLDACSSAKDVLTHIKHNIQHLLSAFRRKDAKRVQCYLISRTNSRKMIQKSLKALRSLRSKHARDDETLRLFKEAESATIAMCESLLSYAMGAKIQNGWSFISKLKVSHEGVETYINEFVKVDAFLQTSNENDTHLSSNFKTMDKRILNLTCLYRLKKV